MKKIILLAGLLFCGLAQAQIVITTNNGAELTENFQFLTSSLSSAAQNSLQIHVQNNTANPIKIKMKLLEFENAAQNGADPEMQYIGFCFGEICYYEVAEGNTVPNPTGYTIAAGSSNTEGDHFISTYPGDDPTLPVQYNLQLIEVNDAGEQINVLRNFSYRYEPTASVDDLAGLQNMGITVKNTVVSSMLELDSAHNATLQLFDITGKLVKGATVTEGVQAIDLSALNAAVYIAKFTTTENKTAQIRIVKN